MYCEGGNQSNGCSSGDGMMAKVMVLAEVRIWITLSPSDILSYMKEGLAKEVLAKDIIEEMLEDLRKSKKISDYDLWKVTVEEK